MLKKLTPVFMVEDVERALDFYRDVIGFQVLHTVPGEGEPLGFAILQEGDVEVMLQSRKSVAGDLAEAGEMPIGASISCYIEVEDVQALYDRVHEKVNVVSPMKTTFYGMKEFSIRDPHGYYLAFAERAGD